MGWGWLCYAKNREFYGQFSTISLPPLLFRAENGTAAKLSFCNGPFFRLFVILRRERKKSFLFHSFAVK